MSRQPQLAAPASSLKSLTLYVAGDNTFSRRAQANLKSILEQAGVGLRVRTVDVLKYPELTMQKRIFVTPALVIAHDEGVESLIIGDFTEPAKVLRLLAAS